MIREAFQVAAEDPVQALGWVALTSAVGSVVGNAVWLLIRWLTLEVWDRVWGAD